MQKNHFFFNYANLHVSIVCKLTSDSTSARLLIFFTARVRRAHSVLSTLACMVALKSAIFRLREEEPLCVCVCVYAERRLEFLSKRKAYGIFYDMR